LDVSGSLEAHVLTFGPTAEGEQPDDAYC